VHQSETVSEDTDTHRGDCDCHTNKQLVAVTLMG